MIITSLGGGIGNQMFQYALGRKLAIKNRDKLFLDTSVYELNKDHKHYRVYGLHHFNITAPIATKEQIDTVKYPHGKIIAKIKNRFERHILRQRHVKFEPRMLKKTGNIYLAGFWQSEKYFKDIRPVLIKEFSLKNPVSPAAKVIADSIHADKNTVSVHIRRGDYAESEESKNYFGTHCDESYYLKGLKFISERVGSISVFVFSDDIEWVKKNIHIPYKTIYVSEDCPDYERLILMSMPNHHIIANSTFGWWSAWLDDKPDKIVVGPSIWTPGPRLPVSHILPPEWIRI